MRYNSEKPAAGDGGLPKCLAGQLNTFRNSQNCNEIQQTTKALGAALIYLPNPDAMGLILRVRLDTRQRLWLASAALWSLSPCTAEKLAEAALHDLRAGHPIPPFTTLREEARDWAAFASRGELRAYLGACWNCLPETERSRFLSAVRPKRRAVT